LLYFLRAKVAFFFQTDAFLSFFYLQVSKNNCTFADVIELNRHIEILLLSSDCVIVPDLGGFMTHHVDARYDDEDNMFVPPLRTLGFNPQLTMNDSLLAQSYIEAYDINYPEAIRRIEAEVTELKQQLYNDGFYEMTGIGVLSLNEDRHIVFEPCEAGLLTPSLYGLGAFEMLPLDEKTNSQIVQVATQVPLTNNDSTQSIRTTTKDGEKAIIVKMSWLRNAAIAAAIIIFLLFTPTIINNIGTETQQPSMSEVDLLPLPNKTVEPKKLDTSAVNIKHDSIETPAVEENVSSADTTKIESANTNALKAEAIAKTTSEPIAEKETGYCLVLASQVAQQGAENLVSQMKQHGYEDTRVNINRNVRRVVYGHYPSQDAAYQALNKLRNSSSDFDEAWVYKIN
jgi:cell division septation protein DedD